jgi:hypothetical protein
MLFLKRLGVAFVAVLAVGVTMVAVASAADPILLFAGQTATISQPAKGTLTTLKNFFSIECPSAGGEVKTVSDGDTFTGKVEFKNCTALGSSVNSLGDGAGIILFKFKGLTCLFGASEAELKICALIESEEVVHIEGALLGLVEFLKGSSQAGELSPDNVSTKELKLKLACTANGDPSILSVKDLGVTQKDEIKVLEHHEGEEDHGCIKAELVLTTANAGTLDG